MTTSLHTTPAPALKPARTLSKSDYILARTCRAKLYFRENGYPDKRDADPYLHLLATGGYMVEALAKARYADGVQLEYGGGLAADAEATRQQLEKSDVTLFEATLVAGRKQARVDILEKKGNVVRLIEVKAKSFDGQAHLDERLTGGNGVFRQSKKPGHVRADWRPKLEDLTYQVLLLENALPGVEVRAYLALVDNSKRARLNNVPQFFELIHRAGRDGSLRLQTARYTGSREQLADLDLVTEVDVSAEVDLLRAQVEEAAGSFESQLDAPLEAFTSRVTRSSNCVHCEFRHSDGVQPSGFDDCWGPLALPKPHMLELYSIGTARAPNKVPLVEWMVTNGMASLFEIPRESLVKADGSVGITSERQRRQIANTRSGEIYVGPELRTNIETLQGKLHFIDFETSRLALPYHATMRPYGLVAFQWSCHTPGGAGAAPLHSEWLNSVDVWPNQLFAESLRASIGDEGPVLTWSHFEGSVLNEIVQDLGEFARDEPELVEWMKDVVGRRIVDMHNWARTQYYNPGMRGRTSIKVVLDALWKSDAVMRDQFRAWSGLVAELGDDPYRTLPPVEINGVWQDVHEGTGAMLAYQEMMYGADKSDLGVKEQWGALLKQYCRLDTLSMVLIFEHWRRLTRAV